MSVLIGQLFHQVIDRAAAHLSLAKPFSRFLDTLGKHVSRVFYEPVPNYGDQGFLLICG